MCFLARSSSQYSMARRSASAAMRTYTEQRSVIFSGSPSNAAAHRLFSFISGFVRPHKLCKGPGNCLRAMVSKALASAANGKMAHTRPTSAGRKVLRKGDVRVGIMLAM